MIRLEYIRSKPSIIWTTSRRKNRLHNWALNRLQYRQDFHKGIQDHSISILIQDNLTLKFEITVRLINKIHHPLPLAHPENNSSIFTSPFLNHRNNLQIR